MGRGRLRDLGITTGLLPTGKWNAITDVPGVKVGVATLITETPHVVRTGVTAIWPRGPEIWQNYCFAGTHSFNGNGEMTGIPWIAEQGLLGAPICITNTWSVGTVRDAISAAALKAGGNACDLALPGAEHRDLMGYPAYDEAAKPYRLD